MDAKQSDVSSLKKVAKGASYVFIGMILSKIISFFYRYYVARSLGPEGYGMIEIGISIVSFAWVFASLGITGAPARYAAFFRAKSDERRIKGTIHACLIMLLPLAVVSTIILLVISPILAPVVTSNPLVSGEMTFILYIMSVTIPFIILNAVFRESLRGLQNMKHLMYSEYIIFNSVQLGFVLVFLSLGWDVIGAAMAYLLSIVITTASFFYYMQKRTFPIISKIRAIKPYREILFFSLPLFLGSVSIVFLTWTDTLFIGVFQNATWSGIYNAALPLAGMIFVIQKAFGGLVMPMVTEMHVKNNKEQIARLYKNVTNWIFYAGFPFLLILTLFSGNALNFVFGPDYVPGAVALSILTLGYFINSILSNSGPILIAMKKTKVISFNRTLAAVLNIILNFILIPIYGIMGAAAATMFSLNLGTFLCVFHVWKKTGMQPFTTRVVRSFIAGVISIAFIYLIAELFWEHVPILWMIVLFVVFMGLYSLLLLALGALQKHDLEILKMIEKKAGLKNKWFRKIIRKFLKTS